MSAASDWNDWKSRLPERKSAKSKKLPKVVTIATNLKARPEVYAWALKQCKKRRITKSTLFRAILCAAYSEDTKDKI